MYHPEPVLVCLIPSWTTPPFILFKFLIHILILSLSQIDVRYCGNILHKLSGLRYKANPAKNKTSVNIITQINATVTKT